jgi:hypothetical protein
MSSQLLPELSSLTGVAKTEAPVFFLRTIAGATQRLKPPFLSSHASGFRKI